MSNRIALFPAAVPRTESGARIAGGTAVFVDVCSLSGFWMAGLGGLRLKAGG